MHRGRTASSPGPFPAPPEPPARRGRRRRPVRGWGANSASAARRGVSGVSMATRAGRSSAFPLPNCPGGRGRAWGRGWRRLPRRCHCPAPGEWSRGGGTGTTGGGWVEQGWTGLDRDSLCLRGARLGAPGTAARARFSVSPQRAAPLGSGPAPRSAPAAAPAGRGVTGPPRTGTGGGAGRGRASCAPRPAPGPGPDPPRSPGAVPPGPPAPPRLPVGRTRAPAAGGAAPGTPLALLPLRRLGTRRCTAGPARLRPAGGGCGVPGPSRALSRAARGLGLNK